MTKLICIFSAFISLLAAIPSFGQNDAELKGDTAPANGIWLDQLDLSKFTQGWQTPQKGLSVDKNPITLGGEVFTHGLGAHTVSYIAYELKGAAKSFSAMVGVDNEKTDKGSVIFIVQVDGKTAFKSPIMRCGEKPVRVNLDLTGAKTIQLKVSDAGDGMDSDHADWAGALIVMVEGSTVKPVNVAPITPPGEKPRMVIPAPVLSPVIHAPRITGATPGNMFLFLIPATGDKPMTFSAKNLPDGLKLNRSAGIISGALKADGNWNVVLTAKNAKGSFTSNLKIVGGKHKLALTPPMGWNSWNVWAGNLDADKTRAAADSMIKSGLAGHGYQYINMDDTWEAGRDAEGKILTNKKFPDMKSVADYIHSLGLKVGIYSSPGPKTCGGYEGSYQHEMQDAQSYADWGMDYLKYDWCSYGDIAAGDNSLEAFKKPYINMREKLDAVKHDIVYSLCQYGMGDVWKWGDEIGANCWRTTGDIGDSWGSMTGNFSRQVGLAKYAGPGHWHDPDMLILGQVGWGNPHPTSLTPNEQLVHFSLWSMVSSILLIGCDMTKLDTLTTAILSNDEVIDVDQDPLGKIADRLPITQPEAEIWTRPLYDGTHTVLFVNMTDEKAQTISIKWSDLGIKGKQPVRDLWLHKNVGSFEDSYSVEVPYHGCVMVKIGQPKTK